tara:strand:- start:1481 stop:2173 length:693 start_codon:yes stop_codon:yes gene_type:complete
MSNLMQIETDFLASAEVRTNINFDTIFNLRDSLKDAKKSKFEKSLKLAKMVSQSVQWFNASETKQLLEDNGIDWSNTEDFFNKVYGWQKSFGYKMVKAGKLQEDESAIVTKFKRQCTTAENNGEDANRSVEGLLKFAKAESDGEEAEVTRAKTYATFSIAKDGINGEKGYSIRLTDEGVSINGELANGDIKQDFYNDLLAMFNDMNDLIQEDRIEDSLYEVPEEQMSPAR